MQGGQELVPHQHVVLGDRDVVGMHGKPDALLHLRGESPRLTGALAPLLPRAPEQKGTEMDRVKMQPGLNSEDIGGAIISDRIVPFGTAQVGKPSQSSLSSLYLGKPTALKTAFSTGSRASKGWIFLYSGCAESMLISPAEETTNL